jgi:hypothetical protein
MLGVVYYFSDVPFMQYQNMYQVVRTGRKTWAMGQIGGILLQSFLIMGISILISMLLLLFRGTFSLEWGSLLHTAAVTKLSLAYNYYQFSYKTMQMFRPWELMSLTFVLGGLIISFTGLLMFAVSLLASRVAAMAVSTGLAAMIYVMEWIHPALAVRVGRFMPMNWLRVANLGVTKLGFYRTPTLEYMLTFLLIGIPVLSALIVWRIRRIEFEWTKED